MKFWITHLGCEGGFSKKKNPIRCPKCHKWLYPRPASVIDRISKSVSQNYVDHPELIVHLATKTKELWSKGFDKYKRKRPDHSFFMQKWWSNLSEEDHEYINSRVSNGIKSSRKYKEAVVGVPRNEDIKKRISEKVKNTWKDPQVRASRTFVHDYLLLKEVEEHISEDTLSIPTGMRSFPIPDIIMIEGKDVKVTFVELSQRPNMEVFKKYEELREFFDEIIVKEEVTI